MPKKARLSGIKALRTYTIDETAAITDVSSRTVRNWIANGLYVMDDIRPVLIRGDDLRCFLKDQRSSRKVKTQIDEFYCCRCRAPRKAAGGFADCNIKAGRVMLKALCETCEAIMSKPVAEAFLEEVSHVVDLTVRRHD